MKTPRNARALALSLLLTLGLVPFGPLAPAQDAPKPAEPSKPADPAAPRTDTPNKDVPPAEPPPNTRASDNEPPVDSLTVKQLETRKAEIKASSEIAEDVKTALTNTFDEAISFLNRADEQLRALAQYKQWLETKPGETEQIKQRIEQLTKEPPKPYEPPAAGTTPARELDQLLAAARNELQTLQRNLADAEKDLAARKERPTIIRNELTEARARLDEIDKALKSPPTPDENPMVTESGRALLRARQRYRAAQADALEQERLAQSAVEAWRAALRDEAALKVQPADVKVRKLEAALNAQLQRETQLAAEEAERARRAALNKHEQIRLLTERNDELTTQNKTLLERVTALDKRAKDGTAEADALAAELTDTQKKIDKEGVSRILARSLIQKRRELPNLRALRKRIATLEEELAVAEETLEINDLRLQDLLKFDGQVEQIMAKVEESDPAKRREIETEVRNYLSKQKEYLDAQQGHLKKLRDHYLAILAKHTVLSETVESYAALMDKHLLWIPDAEPLKPSTLRDAGAAAAALIDPNGWRLLGRATVQSGFLDAPVPAVTMVLLAGALLFLRRRATAQLETIGSRIKRVNTDRFHYTLTAAGLELLRIAPIPILILYAAWQVRSDYLADDTARALAAGLYSATITWLAVRGLTVMLRSGGVADAHFRWKSDNVAIVRRNLRWFLTVAVIGSFLMASLAWMDNVRYETSLARLAFMAVLLSATIFVYRVFHPGRGAVSNALAKNPSAFLTRLRHVWFAVMLLGPVALCVAVGIGYFYTGRQLGGERLQMTAWLLVGVVGLYNLLIRWMLVAARKLALRQAMEKREARKAAADGEAATAPAGAVGEGGEIVIEEPTVDLAAMNEQTRQLIRTFVVALVAVGLYLIWAGVLPALQVLDEVNLWAISADEADNPVYLTLAGLLGVVLMLFVTYAASKNVPGLLEMILLKRLSLDAGGRYAASTLLRYAIVVVGIVIASQIIGFTWDKLQWLVAALSVGLGFGLQEIVANFVSGIILLFERPIRVGDIVTVGDTTGTVTRIRIRATTITDWDRKEFIVPNKEFITGRLLNWTLTDTINRIVLNVGVAYGSDTDLARSLILQAAKDHPLILDEPGPIATFEGFGDSSLNLVLRAFLPDMANRLAVITDLHTRIDKSFRANDIEIPFPQRDLHLRSVSEGVSFNGKAAVADKARRVDDRPARRAEAEDQAEQEAAAGKR